MTEPEALDERFREVEREGAGDQEGLTLVRHLLERANTLAPSGRDRLRARAETLLERYRSRSPNPRPARERVDSDRWG